LFLAQKELDEETYEKWSKRKYDVIIESNNDEEQVANIDGEIEKDLELIGSTAIEDKLQENVANSI
jgi:magnesium-transporting ATPase (P-type)